MCLQLSVYIYIYSLSLLSALPPPQAMNLSPHDPINSKVLIENIVNNAHIPSDGKCQLQQLLERNTQACTSQLGQTNVLKHRIYTNQPVPIKQKPYRMSPVKQALVKEQLEEMLARGIVEPSCSGWASPVVLVPKKDASMRFCVDYRKLNAKHWQVAMDHSSKAKTAFITPSGLFQFNVMLFGLKNAPATFQRLMETVLKELRGKLCFVYIDDIIVYSSNLSHHFQDLQIVLHRLQNTGLTINLKKSKFCLQEISFLGHVVTTQGIKADPNRIEAIRSYPVPTNLREVQ